MAAERRKPAGGPKSGMWFCIAEAVRDGWGATARLITVLVVRGLLLVGVIAAVGDSGIGVILRAALSVFR